MKILRLYLLLVPVLIAESAAAKESRMSILAESYLIDNLEKDGMWRTKASDRKIEYSCLKCGRAVDATLEVVALPAAENKGSLAQRYLSERKSFCIRLATEGNGRCLGTVGTSMRGGGLTGFQSQHEQANSRVTEILFFYSDRQHGPEIIRTTIAIENGASVPPYLIDTFRWHMARLTILW